MTKVSDANGVEYKIWWTYFLKTRRVLSLKTQRPVDRLVGYTTQVRIAASTDPAQIFFGESHWNVNKDVFRRPMARGVAFGRAIESLRPGPELKRLLKRAFNRVNR